MTGETVVLGSKVFPSKAAAEKYLRRIKDDHRPRDFLAGDEATAVLDALQRHPACAEKIGLGVERVGLYSNGDTRSGHGFGIERVDGTVARFSYHECFAAERRSHEDRALEAFRHVVRPHILRRRDRTFEKHGGKIICPITGAPVEARACHVDHMPPSFAELVSAFLADEASTLDTVRVEVSHGAQVEAVLIDHALSHRWVRFHNSRVKLRIVSVEGHRIHHEQG